MLHHGAIGGAAVAADSRGSVRSSQLAGAADNLTPVAVQSSDYTASPGDYVPVDASSASVTITLPTAPADQSQVGATIVALTAANAVHVVCGGSDAFYRAGGPTSLTLQSVNQGVLVQYQASQGSGGGIWYVLAVELQLGIPLGAAALGSDGTIGGAGGSPLSGSVLSESRGHSAPSLYYDPTPNGGESPNFALGSTFTQIRPGAFSNQAFGTGYRAGVPAAGNLSQITTGDGNTAVGAGVLNSATTDSRNTGIGADALSAQNGATSNTAVGAQAGESLTTGSRNVAIGQGALHDATTGTNTAVGASAMHAVSTGTQNTAMGYAALASVTTNNDCTAMGHQAIVNGTGASNTAVGYAALAGSPGDSTGASNTAVGSNAIQNLTTGSANAALGASSGHKLKAGSYNTHLGFNAGYTDGTRASGDVSNATLIGERAQSQINDVIVLGKAIANRPNLYFGVAPTVDLTNGARGAFYIANAATQPTATAVSGGVALWASGGHLYGIGGAGTVVTIV